MIGVATVAGGDIHTYSEVGARLPVTASGVHAGRISGSLAWCQVTSGEYTTIRVMVPIIL